MVIPDICALIERTFPDGTTRRVLFDAGVRKVSTTFQSHPLMTES